MNRNLFLTRRFELLLLVTFVYQLGAGECGCLDHNGWYQIGKSCLVTFSGPSNSSHAADDCDDEDHCDEHGQVVYLAKACTTLPHSDSKQIDIVPAASLGLAIAMLSQGVSFHAHREQAERFPAVPVRAEFQIFLI